MTDAKAHTTPGDASPGAIADVEQTDFVCPECRGGFPARIDQGGGVVLVFTACPWCGNDMDH